MEYRQQDKRGSQPDRNKQSKRIVFRRSLVLMLVFGVGLFIPLLAQLWNIAIVHHDEYQAKATRQQLMDVTVSANRGDILDANGEVLAMSATVYNLILAPKDLVASVNENKFKDEDGNLDEEAYNAEIQRKRDEVVDGLCELMPDLDREDLERRMQKVNSQYEVLATQIEEADAKAIRTFIEEHNTSYYLYLTPDTKRYYPFASLASQVLGFVNSEGGAYGLEAGYEDVLKGIPGRVVTGKTGENVEMYNSYSNYIDAINGYDLTLTLDATIQSYAEQMLEKGIEMYDVQNGGFCLVMDPNTGAVLAMASSPEFDPNNYSVVTDSFLQADIAAETPVIYQQLKAENDQKPADEQLTDQELQDQAKSQATASARETQWRNRTIKEPYEPGSTFKALVLAAALEEGVVSESDTFTCTGSVEIGGHVIHCSKREGHGTQTLAEAVQNSCNPAFIAIGQRLGAEKFYEYFQAFGMTEITGIDLPGEEQGINWGSDMGITDLAVASFGQRFTVTPLQLVTGFSAVINGGNLYQPYVVQKVTDSSGTVVEETEPTLVRQVVSEQTSQRARTILETVVSQGGGKNAYQAGYRIGGKTGSAETLEDGRTIVSFMGLCSGGRSPRSSFCWPTIRPRRRLPAAPTPPAATTSAAAPWQPPAGELIAQILDYMGWRSSTLLRNPPPSPSPPPKRWATTSPTPSAVWRARA
mgnify:CR=1 FL=1